MIVDVPSTGGSSAVNAAAGSEKPALHDFGPESLGTAEQSSIFSSNADERLVRRFQCGFRSCLLLPCEASEFRS